MKRLGVVENLSYDGSVLVRSDFAPPNGAWVVDHEGKAIGSVWKVFGPVKQPFAAVRPADKPALRLVGSEVYLAQRKTDGKPQPKEHRRDRRSH